MELLQKMMCLSAAALSLLASGQQPNNPVSFDISARCTCHRMYNHIEEALVTNAETLFTLKDALSMPGNTPLSVLVHYELHYVSNGARVEKHLFQGWSDSEFLSIFHRSIITKWQTVFEALRSWFSPLSSVFNAFVGSPGTIILEPVNITLSITEDIGELPDAALECAIKQLTEWLKAYAVYGGKPQRWDGRDKGYAWKLEGISSKDIWKIITILGQQILDRFSFVKILYRKLGHLD